MMKKKSAGIIKSVITLGIFITMLSTTAFAAWWGTPGYEWARERRITSLANNSALNNKVSHENFYSILINYLRYKNVTPKDNIKQNLGQLNTYNKAIDGIIENINSYISRTSLTPNDYRVVSTYIDHISRILNENANLLPRDDLKSVDLYMSIAKYKAATLIDDDAYRAYVIANIGPVKYKELIAYNIKPYYGDISRREFLVLMFSLLSEQSVSEDEILKQFSESGVLVGYNDDLMLSKNLTYAEMFTFLRRFEVFEFNPSPEESAENEESTDVVEVD